MRVRGFKQNRRFRISLRSNCGIRPFVVALLGPCGEILIAQTTNQEDLAQQIQKLTDAMASTRAQLEQSQRQLDEMQKQLNALRLQMAQSQATAATLPSPGPASSSSQCRTKPLAGRRSACRSAREQEAGCGG